VSGAVKNLEGCDSIDIEVGNLDFSVTYDPEVTTPDQIMEAIRESGEAVAPR